MLCDRELAVAILAATTHSLPRAGARNRRLLFAHKELQYQGSPTGSTTRYSTVFLNFASDLSVFLGALIILSFDDVTTNATGVPVGPTVGRQSSET